MVAAVRKAETVQATGQGGARQLHIDRGVQYPTLDKKKKKPKRQSNMKSNNETNEKQKKTKKTKRSERKFLKLIY